MDYEQKAKLRAEFDRIRKLSYSEKNEWEKFLDNDYRMERYRKNKQRQNEILVGEEDFIDYLYSTSERDYHKNKKKKKGENQK